jgi:Ca2+-binding RTX toxin-like protein
VLIPGGDDDLVSGGGGTSDDVSYGTSPDPVTVDLVAGTATGDGTDTLVGIEAIIGSTHDDTLIGDANDNIINGGVGNDTCTGGGGNDTFLNCEVIN